MAPLQGRSQGAHSCAPGPGQMLNNQGAINNQGAMNGAPTVPLAGDAFMRPWPRPNTKK